MNKHGVISLPLDPGRNSEAALQPAPWTEHLLQKQPSKFALMRIWRLALFIESDPACVDEWYRSTPIRELKGLTAQQLVARGDSTLVIDFLRSIRRGEQG